MRATTPVQGEGTSRVPTFHEPLYTLLPHRKNFNICQFSRPPGGKEPDFPGRDKPHQGASGSTFTFTPVSPRASPEERTVTKRDTRLETASKSTNVITMSSGVAD